MNTSIYADSTGGCALGFDAYFVLDAEIPTIIAFDNPGPPKAFRDSSSFAKTYQADFGNFDTLLHRIEDQSAATVRKLELMPT